ncbi:MAG: FAD-dependent oxidoreductase, partial [Candidatus Nanoarchaeia archaeon]
IIIGGGVVGTALLYTLSNYTNVPSMSLLEAHDQIGAVNSHHNNNSQTLHFGDIETNYTVAKAKKVNKGAVMVKRYVERCKGQLCNKTHKMVLAVGHEQVAKLKKRFEEFKHLFPKLKLVERKEIAKLEPKVVEGRDPKQEIAALVSPDGYAINFRLLSEAFVDDAIKSDKKVDLFLGTCVRKIRRRKGKYVIHADTGNYVAPVVLVCAGSHSLIMAKQLGYGKQWGLLPVAGSFFGTKETMLNGKVYTMQMKKLPFAAIHGDPAVTNPNETRFGPTAKVLPMLERHNYKTIPDFLKTSVWSIRGILSLINIISDWTLLRYVVRQFTYDLPFIGKRRFIKEVRKIVPTLKLSQLRYRKGYGGIRPQIVDTNEMRLVMGDAMLEGDNIIFNITPSPGASVCLQNAYIDTKKVMKMFRGKFRFNEKKFLKEHS